MAGSLSESEGFRLLDHLRKPRACFAKAKAVLEQDAHVVSCSRDIFYFRAVNDRCRLIEFAADSESAA